MRFPLAGRLMALADVYDALISKRVYKDPMPHEKAIEIIVEGKGTHFDPDVVDAFLALEDTFHNIALTFADCNEERNMLGGKDRIGGLGKSIEHILLVEDNEINLEIMLSQLTSLGYNVETAVNGKEALVKLQRNTYDVILTDIKMPVMDGYELAAEIQKLEKDTKDPTPVFAITASDFDLNDELAKSLGFTGYMLKPLDLDLLKKKLAHIGFNGKPWV